MGKVEQERSAIGNEFQMVGAAKVNERRPFAERISGTVSRCLSRDRTCRFLELRHVELRDVIKLTLCNLHRHDVVVVVVAPLPPSSRRQ